MRGTWRNLDTPAGQTLLDLLHREAEGELTLHEQALLAEHNADMDVQAARTALRRAVTLLSGPNPPLPRSVAQEVASEIGLRARLSASPPLPQSVAARVVAEIGLAQRLTPPPSPRSVAAAVTGEIRAAQWLAAAPAMPGSVASAALSDIRTSRDVGGWLQQSPVLAPPASMASALSARIAREGQAGPESATTTAESTTEPEPLPFSKPAATPGTVRVLAPWPRSKTNPAPLLLVGGLLLGVTLLTLTTAWPNLAAGAVVLRALMQQVSPLSSLGFALLLLTSALILWKPTPQLRRSGALAYALAGLLAVPGLYNIAGGGSGLNVGRNVTVNGPVEGNVIAIGGNVVLESDAQVSGEVVTLLGDVHREPGAEVGGRVNALLGHVPGDEEAIQTAPVSDLSLATAAAFRPVLGWLGGAAWPQIFVALTGSVLLLLFLVGAAPTLARQQRHAPMLTLSLGILMFAALVLPSLGLALAGFLGPALVVLALVGLLIATGLSVSVYDAGRALAYRLRVPVPDAVGALLGLSAFAASLSYAPLSFSLALIGGVWGAGTLFLSQRAALAATK